MGSALSVSSATSVLASLRPFHLLGYGMLLGTELYQSFFMTKICYQVLPRSAFHTLQKKVFPVYFALQSSLVLLLIFTYPPYSVVSLIKSTFDLTTFTIAGAVAFLNYFVYGPATSAAMMDRIHQETRDGRKNNEEPVNEEMRQLNRNFSRQHAMSIHLNLIAIIATICYGFSLSLKP